MSSAPDLKPDPQPENEEKELCMQCLTDNQPGSPFCQSCGAPLNSYAATGPFESLFAEGHVYRRAAEQPRLLIVVLGMWLIFGITALGGITITVISWEMDNLFGVLTGIGLLAVSLLLVGKTTKNYLQRQVTKSQDHR